MIEEMITINGKFSFQNYKRVAEVWMDEYKEYLYKREPERYNAIDPGNLTKQKAIREKLKCKPFKWFMEEIAFDLTKKYPPVEPADFASGAIQSISNPSLCIDTMNHGKGQDVGLFSCAENLVRPHTNQFFLLSWHKDMRMFGTTMCWDLPNSYPMSPILFHFCHGQQGNQFWKYDLVRDYYRFQNLINR